MQDILSLGKHNITMLRDGSEGMQLLQEGQRFDVVFLDMWMPMMSGKELFQWMKENCHDQASRVVFLTGDTFDHRTEEFLKSTRQPYISKPFDVQIIADMVDKIIVNCS
jgi:CheY-like chemotaxis protein